MKKKVIISFFLLLMFFSSFRANLFSIFEEEEYIAQLRADYSSGDYSRWEKPFIDSIVAVDFEDIGILPPMKFPADNPFSQAKRELGKILFFDPRLSSSKQIACASCHDSELGWADGRTVSFGHDRKTGTRNSMSIINIGYHKTFFWDGRANSLEEQMLFPLKDTLEMHSSETIALENIRPIKEYAPLFEKAFGDSDITIERIQKAIATFQRTINSGKSKFDRFISGESNKFTDEEVIGLHLFRTKARCINCHNTPLFSDQKFHNVGLTYYGLKLQDLGRYNITQEKENIGQFKTPSLREVGRTAPYMHNGLMPHLSGIIQMYNVGMPRPKPTEKQKNDPLFPKTDTLLQELHLSKEEMKALEAFLLTLSSPVYREKTPNLPN
ncbi:cytochrome-c peroxidase [Capnocytophaga canimorsus]|uniref:cytochrome-c peroxidase n=1 Tax=Capnocytophaga canimorsus TaxID=28188 RepID=UPI0015629C53|nr:cytochrome c peroxidase [Capnocytophaga canimorsus]